MIIAFIDNQETFEKLHKLSDKRIDFNIREAVERCLRKEFENAGTSPTACSVIDAARRYGCDDLADELTSDFYTETGREVTHVG